MGMDARLTLSGMLQYDPDLFHDMLIPSPPDPENPGLIGLDVGQLRASWTIVKDDLVNYLQLRTMSMSLAVPDPGYLKNAIHTWSVASIHSWQRIFDTLFFKYNPIWNKDGKYVGHSEGTNTGTGSTTRFTHGYDNNIPAAPAPAAVEEEEEEDDNLSWVHSDKAESGSVINAVMDDDHTERGNIGVTTTQQMIKEEREIAMVNIYDIIADSFIKYFCIALY